MYKCKKYLEVYSNFKSFKNYQWFPTLLSISKLHKLINLNFYILQQEILNFFYNNQQINKT